MEPINITRVLKNNKIWEYSNPSIVRKMADEHGYKNDEIYLSTHKNKKYMIYDPYTNKMVHFGQFPFFDYTKHKDKIRRERFQRRNHKWADSELYSPANLSYYLLW